MNALMDGLSAVLEGIIKVSWQGGVLVLVILAVRGIFRERITPAWRFALWGVLLARLLLVLAPASSWSVYNLTASGVPGVAFSSSEVGTVALVESQTPLASVAVDGKAGARDLKDLEDSNDGTEAAVGQLRNGVPGQVSGRRAWDVAALVWLGLTAILAGVMGFQTLRFARQVRGGRLVTDSETLELLEECRGRLRVSAFLALVETDCVRSPALLGCIRPKLLVPRGMLRSLSVEELRHIFLHELAHVKRGDIWTSWMMNLLTAVHWFNPLIWIARRCFIADREAACDAHALAALDAPGQRAYGHTVLDLMQRFGATRWAPGIAGISENNSNLKRRILMIKHFRTPSRLATWVGAGLCMAVGMTTLTNAKETAGGAVDLSCKTQDIIGYTANDGTPMIAVQVLNVGSADTTVDVDFWQTDDDSRKKIGRATLAVPQLRTATIAVPWSVQNGIYRVIAVIDPDNRVPESDESNNEGTVFISYNNGAFQQNLRYTGGSLGPQALSGVTTQPGELRPGALTLGGPQAKSATDAFQQALRGTGGGPARSATATPSANPSIAPLASLNTCQLREKQMGLVFKMFALDAAGMHWPALSSEVGNLTFVWSYGDGSPPKGYPLLSEMSEDIPAIIRCVENPGLATKPDDTDMVYLGYLVAGDSDIQDFAAAYRWETAPGRTPDFNGELPRKSDPERKLFRLKEGIERFIITDINNPAASANAQARIPVLIEWPDRHLDARNHRGGNVLYMDGHVEFVTYPGKWPMTEETIGILCELAGRDPIGDVEKQ